MTVTFHRLADDEFIRATRTYARQSPTTARRFVTAGDVAVARIAVNPATGAPVHGAYRWVRVGRFAYILFYRELAPGQVMVYAVAHARRRPGYWLRRVNRP